MAGLISGVSQAVGQLGGSSAKTDRGNFLGGMKDLGNVFNWALPFGQSQARTGQATEAAGTQNLGQAGSYFGKLASGNRADLLSAAAPATNAAVAQNDATKRQLASLGTARGGGEAGINQQRDTDLMSKIDNMLFGARTGGAQGLAGVGQAQAGIGLGETGQGIQTGGLAANAAQDISRDSLLSRELSNQMHRQAVGDYSNAFGSIIGGVPWGKVWTGLKGLFGGLGSGGSGETDQGQ